MLRGSTATAAAETDAEFAWRTDAGGVAGRGRILQSECGVHQLSRALLLTAAALSSASLCHAGLGDAAYSADRDDRLYPIAAAAAIERDHDVAAARDARPADAASSPATASSSATVARGPDDTAIAGRIGTLSPVNVQL